jgi:hypothetical protein
MPDGPAATPGLTGRHRQRRDWGLLPRARSVLSLKIKGPTAKEVNGKYVVVWEKVGRGWKLAADIWNRQVATQRIKE